MPANPQRRNTGTALTLVAVVAGMGALAYASVPLYELFCRVTGYGGTTQVAEAPATRVLDRVVTVRFNADHHPSLPWRFAPAQREIKLRVGEQGLAYYSAQNLGDTTITGTSTFNVTPQKAGLYFNKIECFCFTKQRLAAGASAELPVTFFIDPEIVKDHNLDDIKTITLSYTFFRVVTDDNGTESDRTAALEADEPSPRDAVDGAAITTN
jgi:cytochrome c oxidase assembly protein subunit 11